MKEKVKVLLSKHFPLFSFQRWTAQAVSAILKKSTWGQYSILVFALSHSCVSFLGDKRLLFLSNLKPHFNIWEGKGCISF